MNGISPWASLTYNIFRQEEPASIFEKNSDGINIKIYCIGGTLWLAHVDEKKNQIFLRLAYDPAGKMSVSGCNIKGSAVTISLEASFGKYEVEIIFPEDTPELLRYTTTLIADHPLYIPFWPRDMVLRGNKPSQFAKGKVHVSQVGTRSGLLYLSFDSPDSGSLLYMQNLTALNDYCQATGTSLNGVVGGQWPELGFALPPTTDKPLPAGQKLIISDAFLVLSSEKPENDLEGGKQFLDLLARIYLHLPRPETQYHDWPDILEKGLNDLQNNHGCWMHTQGQDYLNAYACDYATPPELMVQLAVLLPLHDYHNWSKKELPAMHKIRSGMKAFYDDKIGSVVRWLPSMAAELDGSEEQLKPNIMDSWYLHHPLLNLSRMAMNGDKISEKLFLDSLPFVVKVARHFKYNWPVFYNMETLEVTKAETQPGKGGEKDVAGLYAMVMLHAWKITGDKQYLNEAKKAAKSLEGKGFDLFYQANNTAFSANAMLWLYQETGEKIFMDLCQMCMANIFKNVQLWDCNYGYAKSFPTFFGVFPLNDAPYTAAYEEQEVFSAMHNFLLYAKDDELSPSLSVLIPEFIRYIVQRVAFYYPPNLPKEMLSEDVKMGEVDRNLWIALEDLHDGWEQSGQVGQEVYGAGVAFGIVPRHFYIVPNKSFKIYLDYPTSNFVYKNGKSVSFRVGGDERLNCRMLIISDQDENLPEFSVVGERNSHKEQLMGEPAKNGNLEYHISGNQKVTITWGTKKLKVVK